MNIPTLQKYIELDNDDKVMVCRNIITRLNDKYRLVHPGKNISLLPLIQNIDSGIFFKILFNDTYLMGLSQEEETAASSLEEIVNLDYGWLRPVHRVKIRPCIISVVPVLAKEYNALMKIPVGQNIDHESGATFNDNCPAFVDFESAKKFCFRYDYRLPSEEEWEYICRAGTTSLFTWGNEIPPDNELEKWLTLKFYSDKNGVFYGSQKLDKPNELNANRFGFYGLYAGEMCNSKFSPGYGTGTDVINEHVLRGGGSLFWPWQCDEWTWCISANRIPSSYGFPQVAFRIVKDIP